MIAATLLGMWLAQAAPPVPLAWPITPSIQEWDLAGVFRLKQEKFLRWQPIHDPLRGWHVELRPVWYLELSPTHPRFAAFSLAVESTLAPAAGAGMLRPRLQYQVPRSATKIGVELPISAFFSSALGVGARVFRPMAFVSGRF